MTAPDALRVRRYVDGELLDERELSRSSGPEVLGAGDAAWAAEMTATGRRWSVVIDDPAGDLPPVRLHGGPAA